MNKVIKLTMNLSKCLEEEEEEKEKEKKKEQEVEEEKSRLKRGMNYLSLGKCLHDSS